jgi:hypothetical protein
MSLNDNDSYKSDRFYDKNNCTIFFSRSIFNAL